jgi:co-chaperonin GroES (HSP10)
MPGSLRACCVVTVDMKVLSKNVLVIQDEATTTKGCIILPQGKEEYPNMGFVLAHGPEVTDVVVGDRVVFKRKPGSAISPEARLGEEFFGLLVLPEDHILAVLDGN